MNSTTSQASSSADVFQLDRYGDLAKSDRTRQLLATELGGFDGMLRVTTAFYAKFHADAHIRQFLGDLQTPLTTHARRLAMYISEMMGATEMPWSNDLESRPLEAICIQGGQGDAERGKCHYARSRQDAHYIAWHSMARAPEKVGRRFKLDDCRVWMRLFFWSLRDCAVPPVAFRYLVKWVGHFIAVYEVSARQFAVHEANWSADPLNVRKYEENGRLMTDVVDVSLATAMVDLQASSVALRSTSTEATTAQ
jgi:hypothetical protein